MYPDPNTYPHTDMDSGLRYRILMVQKLANGRTMYEREREDGTRFRHYQTRRA